MLLLAWYFLKFQKSTPKFHNFIQLGSVSSEILLKTLQVSLSNTMIQVKSGYYCAYMSVFKGRKFKISVIITYFNTFKLKPIIKSDNIHNFTEISLFSPLKVEFAEANFKFLTLPHNSHISHNILVIVLALHAFISHQCLTVSK